MPFESNYYESQVFSCSSKNCKGTLVPVQIREDKKDNEAIVTAKCHKCGKSFKFGLSLDKAESDKWRPVLNEQMAKCTECGEMTLKTSEVKGNPKSDYKIKVECIECKKKSERFVDGELFFLLEGDLPPEERTIITCPTCASKVDDNAKTCPNCGREITCDKCGVMLSAFPNAKHCIKCGDSINLGDFSKKPIKITQTASNSCPNCGNLLTEKHRFCNVCGQEIVCDKCGEKIAPGAVFCNACGDKVKKGKA